MKSVRPFSPFKGKSAMQRDENPNAWHLIIARNLGYYLSLNL